MTKNISSFDNMPDMINNHDTLLSPLKGTPPNGQVLTGNGDGTTSFKAVPTYTLPAATASSLGGVKVGSGIAVQADGTISASSTYNPITSPYARLRR